MKYAIFLPFFFLGITLYGQSDLSLANPVLSGENTLFFTVGQNEGKLNLEFSEPEWPQDFVTLKYAELLDADIHMDLNINLPEDAANLKLRVELYNEYQELIVQETKEFSSSGEYKLKLLDVTEKGVYYQEKYLLRFKYDLTASFTCEQIRPEFDWDQKKFPIITFSLGVVGLGVSEIGLRRSQQDNYQTYAQLWEAGTVDESYATSFLDSAAKVKKIRTVVTYGSGALIAGGVLWYWLNKRDIEKRQNRFDMFCDSETKLSISPDYSINMTGETVGFKLSYRF